MVHSFFNTICCKGILNHVDQHGEDRVTWLPNEGHRFATIADKYKNGYLVVGRSLTETENLFNKIGVIVLLAWVISILFLSAGLGLVGYFIKKMNKNKLSF